MKKQLVTAALILGTWVLTAQNEQKTATIRIKKVENINGVEKVTDTTFTTNDPTSIRVSDDNLHLLEMKDAKGVDKIVIMNVEKDGTGKEVAEAELLKKIEQYRLEDPKAMEGKQVIIKKIGKCDATKEEIDAVKEEIHVTIIKRIDIKDASSEDMKRLSTQLGKADNKLEMEEMKMSPNPHDGKFELSFNLKNKGDTKISIFNIEGKEVYSESLPNFSGEYKKNIDISNNQKGIYFVKIEQGKHTQVKKVVLE